MTELVRDKYAGGVGRAEEGRLLAFDGPIDLHSAGCRAVCGSNIEPAGRTGYHDVGGKFISGSNTYRGQLACESELLAAVGIGALLDLIVQKGATRCCRIDGKGDLHRSSALGRLRRRADGQIAVFTGSRTGVAVFKGHRRLTKAVVECDGGGELGYKLTAGNIHRKRIAFAEYRSALSLNGDGAKRAACIFDRNIARDLRDIAEAVSNRQQDAVCAVRKRYQRGGLRLCGLCQVLLQAVDIQRGFFSLNPRCVVADGIGEGGSDVDGAVIQRRCLLSQGLPVGAQFANDGILHVVDGIAVDDAEIVKIQCSLGKIAHGDLRAVLIGRAAGNKGNINEVVTVCNHERMLRRNILCIWSQVRFAIHPAIPVDTSILEVATFLRLEMKICRFQDSIFIIVADLCPKPEIRCSFRSINPAAKAGRSSVKFNRMGRFRIASVGIAGNEYPAVYVLIAVLQLGIIKVKAQRAFAEANFPVFGICVACDRAVFHHIAGMVGIKLITGCSEHCTGGISKCSVFVAVVPVVNKERACFGDHIQSAFFCIIAHKSNRLCRRPAFRIEAGIRPIILGAGHTGFAFKVHKDFRHSADFNCDCIGQNGRIRLCVRDSDLRFQCLFCLNRSKEVSVK